MSTAKMFQYLAQLGYAGSLSDKWNAYFSDLLVNNGNPDLVTSGEFVPDRDLWASTNAPLSAGFVQLGYFTAVRSESINNIMSIAGGTAAGATPTLCRMGVYSVAANGDLTLEAACANDTALWASTNNVYTRALTSTFNKVVGRRYATAALCVTAAAAPALVGQIYGSSALVSGPPLLAGSLSGQVDLPASISAGSISALGRRCGIRLTP